MWEGGLDWSRLDGIEWDRMRWVGLGVFIALSRSLSWFYVVTYISTSTYPSEHQRKKRRLVSISYHVVSHGYWHIAEGPTYCWIRDSKSHYSCVCIFACVCWLRLMIEWMNEWIDKNYTSYLNCFHPGYPKVKPDLIDQLGELNIFVIFCSILIYPIVLLFQSLDRFDLDIFLLYRALQCVVWAVGHN
jgi:hypothetical protein